MPDDLPNKPQDRVAQEWGRLERAEHALWRNCLLLLAALAIGLAVAGWGTLWAASFRSGALPAGLVILVAIFGAYVWRKKRELGDLRMLLRDLHEASLSPPTNAQFEKLLDLITRSQHNMRELIDTLDHAVFTLSPEGILRVANLYVAQIFGVPFQDLIGHRLDEFFVEPSREQAGRALLRFLNDGSWAGRLPVRLKRDGQLRYFDCRFEAVRKEGRVDAVSGWARDVTSQHESEIRFSELFESLREGIFFTTPEGQLLDANPALVQMLGYESKEELQKINFREVYVDPFQRDSMLRELDEKGSVQDREILLQRKDGAKIVCLCSAFAIRDSFGRVVRTQGTFVEITERREMEKRLHQEQEFVRRLIASFPDMIAVLDREGRYTYVSPRVQDVLGLPPQGYIGQTLGARAHEEDQAKVSKMFHDVINGRETYAQVEFRSRHAADDSWRMLRASAAPLFDSNGKITGVVASARDITDSRRAEQQVAEKEKFAAMGHMMAGAAHELNNPLTAILGVSDLLRERASDDATRRQVEIVLQQARRAAAIVQNLLAFSRPTAQGRTRLRLEQIVQRALQSHQVSLQQKKIQVEFSAPANLPGFDGDVKLLTQVFSNLIANAEQAISGFRGSGTLRISVTASNGMVCAAVEDDGPGIPPEVLGKIFDPFFTTKRPGGGSGLGLTICLAVVKEHGGRIEVDSPAGAGATFRIYLPAVSETSPQVSPPPVSAAATMASQASPALQSHTVLVVDDEESIREIVQEGLSARGMKVEGVASSEEALEHFANHVYEIVLCDFNLPGLNGEQLFEQVRARSNGPAPRFVFMTGDMLDPAMVAAFSEKGAHVLQKPFHVSALAALLAEILEPAGVS
jgi:PAS domain S-box-containing protein